MMVASGITGLEVLATLSSSATLPFFRRPRAEVADGAFGARVVCFRGLALRPLLLCGAGTSASDFGVTGPAAAGVSDNPVLESVGTDDCVRLSLGLPGAASIRAETYSSRP